MVGESSGLLATESTEDTERRMRDVSVDQETEQVIGAAIEVHRYLGPGLLESIYEEALCHEFDLRRIPYERQKPVDVFYKEKVIKGQQLDLIAFGAVILELKAVQKTHDYFLAQLMSQLKATGLRRGLIINFGKAQLVDGLQRVSL